MSFKHALGALAITVAAAAATPASAVTYTLNGSIALTDPTFNRPLAGTPPTTLSAVGTAVHYDQLDFTVNTTGSYVFLLDTGAGGFDPVLGLYGTSFNPASPLTNAIVYNDDLATGNLTQSGFTVNLTAGTSYIAVLTAFSNTGVGNYTFTINGPGTVTPGAGAVPEPASWALMMLGVGAVGYSLRRRQKVSTRVRFA